MEHQHSTQIYTCHMHPQILQDAPGKCPLCGMILEPIAQLNVAHGKLIATEFQTGSSGAIDFSLGV